MSEKERIIAEIITLIKYKNKEYEVRDLINYLCNELEKRDNIINELEKYINEEYIYNELGMKIFDASELQDKLQELKGSDK